MKNFTKKVSLFFRNIRQLRKIDLKQSCRFTYEEQLENFLYYIPNSSIIRPNILTSDETINFLISQNTSLARFGDGEIKLICGQSIPSQRHDPVLAKRLKEVLSSNDPRLSIAINRYYYYPSHNGKSNSYDKNFLLYNIPKLRKIQNDIIDYDVQFLDAAFTAPVNYSGIKKTTDALLEKKQNQYKALRTIWNNKHIAVVTCESLLTHISHNIFDNAKSIRNIYTPSKDAFFEYQEIYNNILQSDTDTIIMLMVGATSKILADDLTKAGYRALDLGHLMKSYDFMLKNQVLTSENSHDFWMPD